MKEYESREFSFPLLPKTPTEQEAAGDGVEPSNLQVLSTRPFPVAPDKLLPFQCIYSFVARQGKRVKLEFDYFQLAGGSERSVPSSSSSILQFSCDIEYVDIYSELTSVESDLLSAPLAGRYCGSVAPQVVISLHYVLKLVFHSRSRDGSQRYRFSGRYSFVDECSFRFHHPFGLFFQPNII